MIGDVVEGKFGRLDMAVCPNDQADACELGEGVVEAARRGTCGGGQVGGPADVCAGEDLVGPPVLVSKDCPGWVHVRDDGSPRRVGGGIGDVGCGQCVTVGRESGALFDEQDGCARRFA